MSKNKTFSEAKGSWEKKEYRIHLQGIGDFLLLAMSFDDNNSILPTITLLVSFAQYIVFHCPNNNLIQQFHFIHFHCTLHKTKDKRKKFY